MCHPQKEGNEPTRIPNETTKLLELSEECALTNDIYNSGEHFSMKNDNFALTLTEQMSSDRQKGTIHSD